MRYVPLSHCIALAFYSLRAVYRHRTRLRRERIAIQARAAIDRLHLPLHHFNEP